MKSIPEATVKGMVLSVSEKTVDGKGNKLEKPFRLITIAQMGRDGDSRNVELKSYNGAKVEPGKVQEFRCSLSAWSMKGDRGDLLSGLTATIIDQK